MAVRLSSRAYVKRVWRVPKDRGAPTYLGALLEKMLRKHGWPATARPDDRDNLVVLSNELGGELAPDFLAAIDVAVSIIARTYRLDLRHKWGVVALCRYYTVLPSGVFKEVKHDPS